MKIKTLTSETWTVKQTENPILRTIITAGIADNFIPNKIITASNWINVAIALKTIKIAAQTDSNKMPTKNIAATFAQHNINARDVRKFMYCSQNINGMPDG